MNMKESAVTFSYGKKNIGNIRNRIGAGKNDPYLRETYTMVQRNASCDLNVEKANIQCCAKKIFNGK